MARRRFDQRELAAIFAGGFAGALLRAAVVRLFPHSADAWPWGTFAVNIVGAFVLGYFAVRLQERMPLTSYVRPLVGTGFCGALTTFSTMQVEALQMVDASRAGLAAAYMATSIVCGFVAIMVAAAVVRRARVAG